VKIVAARDGHNFTASIVISMTGLPAGATYRVAFADNASLSEAVSADLAIYGQAAAATSPALDVSASVPAAGDMISFVFATFETDENWTGRDGDKNITFYRYAGGQLSRLPFTAGRSDSGSLTYQAISTGAGQFLIVDAAPRDLNEAATAINSDIVMLGGLLATLVIALGIMVRRVIKR
jgi:hypothetical protein